MTRRPLRLSSSSDAGAGRQTARYHEWPAVIVTTFPRAVRVIERTLIPLNDGPKLAACIWLPEDADQENRERALR
jgi:hypothetical protein